MREDLSPEGLERISTNTFSMRATNIERLYFELEEQDPIRQKHPAQDLLQPILRNQSISLAHFVRLRELSFQRVDLRNWEAWSAVLPQLRDLRRLSLQACEGLDVFLRSFGEACVMTGSQLEQLEINLGPHCGKDCSDDCLEPLYEHFDKLESLQVSRIDGGLTCTIANISRFGRSLRSLNYVAEQASDLKEIQLVCSSFPNLEQLSLIFAEHFSLPERSSEKYGIGTQDIFVSLPFHLISVHMSLAMESWVTYIPI
jgi:hypothetical protein